MFAKIEDMRAERLIATVLVLQSRDRITAAELAREVGVSVATARRDLEALSGAGIPVYAQPGRHGGWSLLGGARTNLTGLTSAEATAIFERLGQVRPDSDGSSETEGPLASGLRKVLRALPEPFRAPAERARTAVAVDARGWGSDTHPRPAGVGVLVAALTGGVQVAFDYRNRTGAASAVRCSPIGVVDKDGTWYLVAERPDGERRTYRVDRMSDLVTTDQASAVSQADLGAPWEHVVQDVEAARSTCAATILVAQRHVWVLRRQFGERHVEILDESPDADGFIRVRVRAQIPLDIARYLAGWGALVRLVEPDAVRAELARLAAELTAAYPSSSEKFEESSRFLSYPHAPVRGEDERHRRAPLKAAGRSPRGGSP